MRWKNVRTRTKHQDSRNDLWRMLGKSQASFGRDNRVISADIRHETDSGSVKCSTKLSKDELIFLVNMTGFQASH